MRTVLRIGMMVLLSSCGSAPPPHQGPAPAPGPAAPANVPGGIFRDATADAGITFVHDNGMAGFYYLPEITGSGAALLDHDGDGDLDLYLCQARALPGRERPVQGGDRLYRNDLIPGGALRFTDVTDASGIREEGYGHGAIAGDYDNDGFVDLYVTNYGENQLLHNRGDGTFEDATVRAGVGDDRWSTAAAFLDHDRDGWLDLYVANYVRHTSITHQMCPTPRGEPDYCGPAAFPPEPHRLFRNRGDGTFEDVSLSSRIQSKAGSGLGVVSLDADRDGYLDIYVANDKMPNFLWRNRGDGTFEDVALAVGAAYDADGRAEAGMGVDAADVDADGDEDIVVANLQGETVTFYRNDGGSWFSDESIAAGLGASTRFATGFGIAWLDLDQDGLLDLATANGHVHRLPGLSDARDPYPYHQCNQLFRNAGAGRFEEITELGGPALAVSAISRGLVVGDVDNDGDPDVLVTRVNASPVLLLNVKEQRHHWIGFRLVGGAPRERDMLGAEVELAQAGRDGVMRRRCRTDGSYLSSRDPRVLFGLGDRGGSLVATVTWPDGVAETFRDLAVDRYHLLRMGAGS